MEKLDIKSFKNLLDTSKFEKMKILDTTYLNLNPITPLSNIQNTLQNRIFILIIMFINGGLINNPYNESSTTTNFDSLELNKLPNDVFLINYRHFNKTTYSNTVGSIVYLIMTYIFIDLLESDYTLTPRGKTMELPDIFSFSSNIIEDVINDNYNNFTNLMNEISSDTTFKRTQILEISVVEKFINTLFLNISNFVIEKLNKNETSTYNIDKSKIQTLFNKDFEEFSEYRKSFLKPCKDIFSTILQDNELSKPLYKFVTSYFDEENKREDKKYLQDDISSFNKMELFLAKNITELDKQQKNESKINADRLLIIVGNITTNLIYKLSDLTPLLLNLTQICENNSSSELNFKNMYSSELKGGVDPTYIPIIVQGLKGAVEITKVGQNIAGLGVVHAVVTNGAGEIVSASLTTWTGSSAGAVATKVLTYTASTAGSVVGSPLFIAGAVVLVAGMTYYYYGDAIAQAIGIGTAEPVGVKVPTPEGIGMATPEPVGVNVPTAEAIGTAAPEAIGTANPEAIGTAAPEPTGVKIDTPEAIGTATPEPTGTAAPEAIGTATPQPVGVKGRAQQGRSLAIGSPEMFENQQQKQQQEQAADKAYAERGAADIALDKGVRAERREERLTGIAANKAIAEKTEQLTAADKGVRAERKGERLTGIAADKANAEKTEQLTAADKVNRGERRDEHTQQVNNRKIQELLKQIPDIPVQRTGNANYLLPGVQGPSYTTNSNPQLMLKGKQVAFNEFASDYVKNEQGNSNEKFDTQDYFGRINNSLVLLDFIVKYYNYKTGRNKTGRLWQETNETTESIKRSQKEIDKKAAYWKNIYADEFGYPGEISSVVINRADDGNISSIQLPTYNAMRRAGLFEPQNQNQYYTEFPEFNPPNLDMPLTTNVGNLPTDYFMPITPNMDTFPNFNYSPWDMGGIQLEDDEFADLPELLETEDDDDVPELVPEDDYIRELLEQEDDDVKELAKKYKITSKNDIKKIKDLIKRQNITKQFYYNGTTNQSKVDGVKTTVTPDFGVYTAIGPTKQFQDSTSNSGQGSSNSGQGFFSQAKEYASNAASKLRLIGGTPNSDLLQKTHSILNDIIILYVFNGKMFFLIQESIKPKIIQIISILNSISFLENYKKIQLLNNNKLSYENINSYLNDCYSELNKFITNIKGGKKTLLVKTKKNKKKLHLKTYKRKTHNKKTRKRKLIKKKKLTRKY